MERLGHFDDARPKAGLSISESEPWPRSGLTKVRADRHSVLFSLNIRHFPANCRYIMGLLRPPYAGQFPRVNSHARAGVVAIIHGYRYLGDGGNRWL